MSTPEIPLSEMHIDFVRSSGPGGQNVNKVNTKAQLRWSVGASRVFSWEQKLRLRSKLKNRLNKHDEIVLWYDDERSQSQNKQKVIHLLNALVKSALKVPRRRVATKPTRASKEKRLEHKTHRSKIKRERSGKWW